MHKNVQWDKDDECKDARQAILTARAASEGGPPPSTPEENMQRSAALDGIIESYRAQGLTVSIQGRVIRVGKVD